MTIQPSRTNELTVDQLCIQALELSNVTSPTQVPQPAQLAQARGFLGNILKEQQAGGQFARAVTFIEVTMVTGTYKYDLPTDTLDLVGDGMYIPASETDLTKASGETIVQEQTRQSWQVNSAKNATGQPTLYFINRAELPNEVWLWPVPDEAGTIRFQQHQLISDVSDGSATIDLKQFWMQYCVYKLAEMLAEAASFPRDKISALRKYAKEYLRTAKGRANQAVNFNMQVGGYGTRRRR